MLLNCPDVCQYGVIRMDPVAMVEHFGDLETTSRARALVPKTYLVYLDIALDLPFPTSAWFRFQVCPIAPTLRPPIPEDGITSDMAIPIYPNTHHPCGRPPVQTKTPFPFANCYHWYENKATVRLRRMEDQYDDCNAVQITSMQHVKIVRHFENDLQRARAFHSEEASPLAGTGGVHSSSPSTTTPALNLETSFDGLLGMDIFGLAHDKTAEFLPLVDLWFELDEHLTANTIPTPLDFYEEVETIVE
ncbi:hypothetical protein C2E23DRAFT_743973 [Lenzites betulinus]|nr:hypothetical protein C2E23DRAFT_743973 [Lenzites betulinus]